LYADHFAAHRVHREVSAGSVSSSGGDHHDRPSTDALRSSFSLPSRPSSSEFLRRVSRSRSADSNPKTRIHFSKALPTRVSALIAASSGASTNREASHSSLRSAHRLSQPLGGFLRATAFRACFIPKPHPGFACPGLFPFAQPAFPRRKAVPPCRWLAAPHRPKAVARPTGLDFEALIRAKVRHRRLSVTRSGSRNPLQVRSPSRSSAFSPCVPVTQDHPLVELPISVFAPEGALA
jgi:hypothetical protein